MLESNDNIDNLGYFVVVVVVQSNGVTEAHLTITPMQRLKAMSSIVINRRSEDSEEEEVKPWKLFFYKLKHDWSLTLSSMLAFNLLMALLPMAMILFGMLGLILAQHVNLQDRIRTKIINAFPPKANDSVRDIVNMALEKLYHDAATIVTFGVLLAIVGSSRLFVAIDRCLTIIYRVEERKFIRKYLLAMKMLLLFLVLIPLMIIASSIPSFLIDVIPNAGGRFGAYVLGLLTSFAISFVLFEIIYLLIPNRKMTFRQTWRGALMSAGALQVFMILFPLYVRQFMTSYTGQIGFVVILLVFLFYFALILILGAQVNAFFVEEIPPFAVPLGTLVCQWTENTYGKQLENN